MAEFYRLRGEIKRYDWGSPDLIPALLGLPPDGGPCAELWMGGHPGGPSRIELPGGPACLGEAIAGDARRYLGEETAARYGELPFLFKLLAAEKPLSIQAHPSQALAREGFDRENGEGLAPDAPGRSYRDPNHKPEAICALSPFVGMCGFREPGEIARLVGDFLGGTAAPAALREGFAPLLRALEAPPAVALREFLSALLGAPPPFREALTEFALSREGPEGGGCERGMVRAFAELHPGDPAIIAPLYLNVFRLQPGEAVFVKPGTLHAYVRGFGAELMASSDNVLRGGLTSKRVDAPELLRALDFSPQKPQIAKPPPGASFYAYPFPCEEFFLAALSGDGGATLLALDGPSILLVTEGAASINMELVRKGEAIFVPAAETGEVRLTLRGEYALYIASTGKRAGKL